MSSASEALLEILLQSSTLDESLITLYDVVEGWAFHVDPLEAFPFIEKLVDRERTPAGIALVPSQEYMKRWPKREFSNHLVAYCLSQLSDRWSNFNSSPFPLPGDSASSPTKTSLKELTSHFAELPIMEAVDEFVKVAVSFARLVDRDKIKADALGSGHYKSDWNDDDFYNYIYLSIYSDIIESFNAHGVRENPRL